MNTKLLQTIGLITLSGISAWACGEIGMSNYPLAAFFALTACFAFAVIPVVYQSE